VGVPVDHFAHVRSTLLPRTARCAHAPACPLDAVDRQLLVLIAIAVNMSNIVGYWKCDTDAKKKLSQAAVRMAGEYGPSLFSSAASLIQKASAATASAAAAPQASA
jgi:hypothetical protein